MIARVFCTKVVPEQLINYKTVLKVMIESFQPQNEDLFGFGIDIKIQS